MRIGAVMFVVVLCLGQASIVHADTIFTTMQGNGVHPLKGYTVGTTISRNPDDGTVYGQTSVSAAERFDVLSDFTDVGGQVMLREEGNPGAIVLMSLYRDIGGQMGSTVLASTTIALTTSEQRWYDLIFPNLSLQGGEGYWLVATSGVIVDGPAGPGVPIWSLMEEGQPGELAYFFNQGPWEVKHYPLALTLTGTNAGDTLIDTLPPELGPPQLVQRTNVPEPSSLWLFGIGAIAAKRRRWFGTT